MVEALNFFQVTQVRNYKRINNSISIRSITTKFGQQVHLEYSTQMRLIKQVLVTPSRKDHVIK